MIESDKFTSRRRAGPLVQLLGTALAWFAG